MELRSYNVERVYQDCVICSIGENLGVRKFPLTVHKEDIVDMLRQIETKKGMTTFQTCNLRKDGETWTPYLQIVEMLIRLGKKIGAVEYEGTLSVDTIITIKV